MATFPIPIDQANHTKAEQNRLNAQHSTGPKSEAGKKRSSLNALKHGFCSHVVVMPNENLAAFKDFCERVRLMHSPVGDYEIELTQKVAESRWRMNRVGSVEANLFSLGHEHHAHRFQVDDGDTDPTAIQAGFAAAYTFREDSDTFLKLTAFEQRLLKVYKATMEELKRVQAERFAKLKEEEMQLERLRKLHKRKGRAFHPAEFGFVSQPAMIEMHFRRKDALTRNILPKIVAQE